MADGYKMWAVCDACKGTGKNTKFSSDEHGTGGLVDENCSKCGGKKYVFLGWCSADTYTMPTDLPEGL